MTNFHLVRTGLAEAGIDFGVFGPTKKPEPVLPTPKRQTHFGAPNGHVNGHGNGNGAPESIEEAESDEGDEDEDDEEEEDRRSRPVIKLRPSRHGRPISRSRSRRDLTQAAEDPHRPITPDTNDKDSVAAVRFSAHIVAKTDLSSLLPFALIAPEANKRRPRPVSTDSSALTIPASQQEPSEEGGTSEAVPQTPVSVYSSRNHHFLQGPPRDLKGVFIRKFRWGTVDVLDPNHCDFAALRTAVLSTHLKVGLVQFFWRFWTVRSDRLFGTSS